MQYILQMETICFDALSAVRYHIFHKSIRVDRADGSMKIDCELVHSSNILIHLYIGIWSFLSSPLFVIDTFCHL